MVSEEHFDIAVVGAGMVGAAASLRLIQALPQLKVALIAPNESPAAAGAHTEAFDPRVVALTEHSRSLLDSLGIWNDIAAVRACPYQRMVVWDGEGGGSIEFDGAEVGAHNLGHIVENRVIQAHLLAAIEKSAITQFDARVERLIYSGERIAGVVLESGESIHVGLVVAADGARSKLRERADIDVREWSYGQSAIVATVVTGQCHQHTAWQRFMHTGPLAFLPLCESPGEQNPRHCSIVWSADQALAETLMADSDEVFCHRLERAFEQRLGGVEAVSTRHLLPLVQRHARRYVRPGLALVGDAAHSIHPLAGQGVNLGLLDIDCLARELKRASERHVPLIDTASLRRYERERMGHNLTMMAAMEGFKRLFGSRDLALLHLRSRAMSATNQFTPLKNALIREAMGLSLS